MTLHKLPTGQYEVRYDYVDARTGMRRQGRRRFRTRYEAVQFERELMSGRAAVVRDTPTLEAYGREWLETHRKLRDLSPSSYRTYKAALSFLNAGMPGVRVSRVRPRMIEAAISRASVSPQTIQMYRRVWLMLFDNIARDGYLPDNPVRAVAAPRAMPHEICPPDADGVARLLEDVRGHYSYCFFLLAATTGCRESELMGLMWDCVDLDAGTLTIRRQRIALSQKNRNELSIPAVYGGYILRETTKGRRARVLRVPDGVVRYLSDLKKARELSKIDSPYVCLTDAGAPVGGSALRDIARAHGMRVHDLRHAHATILIDAGIPITGVSARLGHSSPAVTVRVYAHALKKQDDAAADVAARLLDDTKDDTTDRSTGDNKFTVRSTKAR